MINLTNNKYLNCALLTLLLPLTGCSDFLDEAPRGEAIAKTATDYDKLFNDSQGFNLGLWEQYYPLWKSDDLIFTEGSYQTIDQVGSYPTSVKAAIEFQDKVYRDDESTPEWEEVTNRIYTYNVIANGVPSATGDEAEKRHLLAEARVSRAYMHFLLAQWFAMPFDESTADTELALPIVTEADTQVMDYDRATVRELYDWIVSEMEEACPDLEDRTAHRMRCYKAAGYALLGKVYFFMGKYDKALEPLRTAYEALQGDENVYLTDHRSGLSAYGYEELSMYNVLSYIPYYYRDNEVLFCKGSSSMRQYYPAYYSMEPTDYLKPEVYALFDSHDLRRNTIITKDVKGNALQYPTATFRGAMTNVGCTLPEVYLMLAESEARAGSADNARTVLAELRATRMMEGYEAVPADVTTQDDLIRFCVDEESREFAGTGYRYYTVRRLWNDPLFQDMKPITHTVGTQTYTLQEAQLKTALPETVLKWNENWR